MSEMRLPDSWIPTTFESVIASVSNGVGGKQNKDGIGVAVSRIETIAEQRINFERVGFLAEYDAEKIERYRLNDGDILFSHINSPIHLGKTAIFTDGKPLYHGINLLRIVVDRSLIYPELFNYYCKLTRSQGEFSMQAQHAVNQSSINQKKLAQFDIPLPPLAEQQEITARLNTLLAQVDTLKSRLDALPAILKRFRQSVLAAAVSGKLTEEWRSSDIKEWSSRPLASVASHIVDCPHSTPKWTEIGKICVRTTGFNPFRLELNGQGYVSEETYEERIKRLKPSAGDILYSREGTVGIACQIPEGVELCLGQRMVLIRAGEEVDSRYLTIVLNSEHILSLVRSLTIGSTAPRVNMKDIKAYDIPLPSNNEQAEIVRQVEQLFAFADQVEQRVKDAQNRVNHLTQSILAKAFRGELTADWRQQHPELITGEHSAEALLARIQAERAAHISAQTSARRGRKKANA